jgi:hypothetical protein
MAIFGAQGGGGGRGIGLMNLINMFRSGGVWDQQKQAQDIARQENERANEEEARKQIQFPILNETAVTNLAHLNSSLAGQTIQNEEAQRKASRGQAADKVGQIPNLQLPEGIPFLPTADINAGLAGATEGIKRTPFEDLTPGGQKVIGQAPRAIFPDMNDADIASRWNADVGARTGTAGLLPTQAQSDAQGGLATTYQPAGILQEKRDLALGKNNQDNAQSLLAKFNSEPVIQNFQKAGQAIDTIRRQVVASAKSQTGSNDITLLTAFMRSIDPGSTVREGEFRTAAESGGVPAQVMGYYNKLIGQGRLTQTQRQEILDTSMRNLESHAMAADALRGRYLNDAGRLGIPKDLFNPDLFGAQAPQPAAQKEGAGKTPENAVPVTNDAERDAVLQAGGFAAGPDGRVVHLDPTINKIVVVGRMENGKFVSARSEGNPGAPLPAALPDASLPLTADLLGEALNRQPKRPAPGTLPFVLPDVAPIFRR